MLLLATFASLRFGDLAALRRGDIDLERCCVRVTRSLVQMNDGKLIEAEPKSRAGRRVVSFPREIAPELRWHLERFVGQEPDSLVFVGPKDGRLRRSNFRDIWIKSRDEAGLPDLHHARSAAYGEHDGGCHGRELARADGADGSHKHTCRDDLPARHQGAGLGDRGGHGGGACLGPAEGCQQEPIGHVSGTTEGDGFLMAVRRLGGTWLDLGCGLERAKGIEPS